MFLLHLTKSGEKQDDGQPGGAHDHVKGMQPHQRIECRAEQVGADRQTFVVDQAVPLAPRAHQKDHAQHDRKQPEQRRSV